MRQISRRNTPFQKPLYPDHVACTLIPLADRKWKFFLRLSGQLWYTALLFYGEYHVRIQTQTLRRKAQEKPPHGIPVSTHRLPSADALHRADAPAHRRSGRGTEPEPGIIGIGGQIIRYPLQETSYWHYDESTGVTTSATEENANITLISTNSEEAPPIDRPVFQSEGDEPPTDADTALLIVQLDHVHITTSHHFEGSDFNDFALFYPGDQLIVQVLGDCSLTGSQYGIYTEGYLTLNGLDSNSALTVTAKSEVIVTSLPADTGGDGDSDGDAVYEGPMAIFSFLQPSLSMKTPRISS